MEYTKASDILREARTLIETRRQEFICLAARQVAGPWEMVTLPPLTEGALNRVTSHIEGLLGSCGASTLGRWLGVTHGISPEERRRNQPKLLATRLAWIDDMIQYFERHGD